MPYSQQLHEALRTYFGFDTFKGPQLEIISSLLSGNDVFVLMPTGGGKSLCYQLPALISKGTAIVISPLIALMKNQVDALRSYTGSHASAHFLNSSLSKSAANKVKADVLAGRTKLLYVAPESLAKMENVAFLRKVRVSFYAVDEAHCISEWGHDFRPEYRKIRSFISEIGVRPVIALTATATPKVQHDIQKSLNMIRAKVFKSSFNRENLFYEIRPKTKQVDREIIKYIKSHPGQSGIVYCLSRKKVDEFSEILKVNDIRALPYHAGLDATTRAIHQDAFLNEEVEVIVATIAFGMGIDKPDVRYVIHYDIPKSLEGYYQETGRAGRDGLRGHCICFYSKRDIIKLDKLLQSKSTIEQEIGKQLLAETEAYAESAACRRKMLLHYFGEDFESDNCGACDNCLNPKESFDASDELADAIETVHELGDYASPNYLALIMMGHHTADVIRNGHGSLQMFGCRKDVMEKDLHTIIRMAILEGYLKKDMESNRGLRITQKGRKFLEEPHGFEVVSDREFADDSPDVPDQPGVGAADQRLLNILTGLRRSVAKKHEVPPYVVFSDPSLEAMTIMYPTTDQELLNIPGVGIGKANRFGEEFLKVIRDYIIEYAILRPTDIRVRTISDGDSKLNLYLIKGIDRKIDLDALAESKGIDMDELLTELESIVKSGTRINIDYYLNKILDEDSIEDLMDYFSETEEDDLNEAFIELGDDYTEEEIRLARIRFISEMGN